MTENQEGIQNTANEVISPFETKLGNQEGFSPKLFQYVAETSYSSPREDEIGNLSTEELAGNYPESFISTGPEEIDAYQKLIHHATAFLIEKNEPEIPPEEVWQRAKATARETTAHEKAHLEGIMEAGQEPISMAIRFYQDENGHAQAEPCVFYAATTDSPFTPVESLLISLSAENLSLKDKQKNRERITEVVKNLPSFWGSIKRNPRLAKQLTRQVIKHLKKAFLEKE